MHRLFAIFLGFIVVGLAIWAIATPNESVRQMVASIDNWMYDQHLKLIIPDNAKASANNPIAIVDIDEKSLLEQGPWPWPRTRFAQLITNLREAGVNIIAFTLVFPEKSDTTASDYLKKIQANNPTQTELTQVLNRIINLHEGDDSLVKAVNGNDVISGILFNQYENYSKGLLPKPVLSVTNANLNNLLIPTFTGYLANFPDLQKNINHGGFISGIIDSDGIVRHVPLLANYKDGIYLSLALEAVKYYSGAPQIEIQFNKIGNKDAVEKIFLGNKIIYTDASGTISIPYQGHSHYFPYYSATDILNHRIPADQLSGKIIFVGATAPGISDLYPTPFESLFPGVEIQANIASAILGNFIPYTPSWSNGAEIAFIILIGGLLAIILPFLRSIALTAALFFLLITLVFTYGWLWMHEGLIFSFTIPLLTVVVLITMNLIYGFLFETRRHAILYKTFTKYVPPEYAKKVSEHPEQASLEGEIKTVTSLFLDIRHFTYISEILNEKELKEFLNLLFTSLSDIITQHTGIIDKYVGDMIIAFWSSDKDPLHCQHALTAAIEMQDKVTELQPKFKAFNVPLVRIGIGINTGEVNIGEIGSETRRAYTIIGDSVNLASRIQNLTKFYHAKTIVGENAYQQCREDFIFRHVDRITVKGRHAPSDIYELICKKEDSTDELLDELSFYNKALENYYHRRWKTAYDQFSTLEREHPDVKIYSIFIKRIEGFFESPPNESWNGVYARTTK